MLRSNPDLTYEQYRQAVRELAKQDVAGERRSTPMTPLPAPTYEAPRYTPPPAYTPRSTYTPPVYTYTPPEIESPRSGSTYDWRSGNSYRWREDSSGNTRVDGMNLNTGSMWQTTIKPNGSMRGTDSNLNPWTYDSNSKTYFNYGTGKMCVGEGAARTCF